MASSIRPRIVPKCSACIQQWIDTSFTTTQRPAIYTQVRNAHRKANASPIPNTIPVMLLQPVPRFGRAGTIIPVPVSYMRNKLYPKNLARYIGPKEDKELKKRGVVIARDPEFTIEVAEREEQARLLRGEGVAEDVEIRLGDGFGGVAIEDAVETDQTLPLLDTILPTTLTIDRPMNLQKSTPDGRTAIYGSVSLVDISDVIRSLITSTTEASKINLADVKIDFLNLPDGEERQRVKHIGSYQVCLSMLGREETVVREVNVVPEAPRTAQSLREEGRSNPV